MIIIRLIFFDVIVMSLVLEHLLNLADVLREAQRILRQEGIVYITIPNVESHNAKNLSEFWTPYHFFISPLKQSRKC